VADAFDPRVIVVGFDPTPESMVALDRAVDLANRFDAALVVVVAAPIPLPEAVPPGRLVEPVVDPAGNEAYERALGEELETVRGRLRDAGVRAEIVTVGGGPGDVVEVAEQRAADLIVVAARSQGLLERLVVGDPAGAVTRRATCDVLVVHDAQAEPAA
jgi:nucleotide-binding universal stress UspA family protein